MDSDFNYGDSDPGHVKQVPNKCLKKPFPVSRPEATVHHCGNGDFFTTKTSSEETSGWAEADFYLDFYQFHIIPAIT